MMGESERMPGIVLEMRFAAVVESPKGQCHSGLAFLNLVARGEIEPSTQEFSIFSSDFQSSVRRRGAETDSASLSRHGQVFGRHAILEQLAQLLAQCGARVGHAWVRWGRIKQERRSSGTSLLPEYCILRGDDACETTLNPGFKWVRWASIGLPATRRTCTPGDVAHPWS